jgi:hypothetical protein
VKAKVEDRDVVGTSVAEVLAIFTIARRVYDEILRPQRRGQLVSDRAIVLDQQHLHELTFRCFLRAAPSPAAEPNLNGLVQLGSSKRCKTMAFNANERCRNV